MKKMALMLNSPYLGGAERSAVHQLLAVSNEYEKTIYIPDLKKIDTGEFLSSFIKESCSSNVKIVHYNYPPGLFKVSRYGRLMALFVPVLETIKLIATFRALKLRENDVIWANGNKVGLVTFIYCFLFSYHQRLIWHFRDYPASTGLFRIIWKLFHLHTPFEFVLVGNSNSVSSELRKYTASHIKIQTIYNPIGTTSSKAQGPDHHISTIGLVSMMAPWKGIHNCILWAALYEKELTGLGIKNIKVYGGSIYQTEGEHARYYEQVKSLHEKLGGSLITFEGLKKPENIFPEVDLLIHPSVRPEPFGRVILEAFSHDIPVISTCLGGAGEIIRPDHEKPCGLKYSAANLEDLFQAVKSLIQKDDLRKKLINNGRERSLELVKAGNEQLDQLFNS